MQLYVIQEILSFPYVLHGLVGKYIFACLDVILKNREDSDLSYCYTSRYSGGSR